jgi:hypothetical protein
MEEVGLVEPEPGHETPHRYVVAFDVPVAMDMADCNSAFCEYRRNEHRAMAV